MATFSRGGLKKSRRGMKLLSVGLALLMAFQLSFIPTVAVALDDPALSFEGAGSLPADSETANKDASSASRENDGGAIASPGEEAEPTGPYPVMERDGLIWYDLSDAWGSGELTVDVADHYFLSTDVRATAPLVLAAPEGEEIVFDFNGHSVTVTGAVTSGIDVSASLGSIVLEDSSYEKGDVKQNLELVGQGVDGSIAAIVSNPALDTEGLTPQLTLRDLGVAARLESIAPDAPADAVYSSYALYNSTAASAEKAYTAITIENCSLNAEVISDAAPVDAVALTPEQTGVATGVYTTLRGVTVQGGYGGMTVSDGGACDWYSTVEDAFIIGADFTNKNEVPLSVYSADNLAGSLFASYALEANPNSELAAAFISALDGVIVVQDERGLCFALVGAASDKEDVKQTDEVTTDKEAEDVLTEGATAAKPVVEAAVEAQAAAQAAAAPRGFSPLDSGDVWTDISAAWRAGAYTISESGNYYLRDDVETTGALTITATTGDGVVLDFHGKTVKVTHSTTGLNAGIVVSDLNLVPITVKDTSYSSIAGIKSQLNVSYDSTTAATYVAGIYGMTTSLTGSLSIENISISAQLLATSSRPTYSICGLYLEPRGGVSSPGVTLTNCVFSAEARVSDRLTAAKCGQTYGAYFNVTNDLAIVAQGCTFLAQSDYATSTNSVFATGLMLARSEVGTNTSADISGCTIRAESAATPARGIQTGITMHNVTIGNVDIEVKGNRKGTLTSGVLTSSLYMGTTAKGSVGMTLNGRLSSRASDAAGMAVDLYGPKAFQGTFKAFTIANGFVNGNPDPLRVYVENNTVNTFFAQFAENYNLESTDIDNWFVDAAHDPPYAVVKTAMADGANGMKFIFDPSNAVARVGDDYYGVLVEAMTAVTAGGTVTLLKDVDTISFNKGAAGDTYAIDLNGHSLTQGFSTGTSMLAELKVVNTADQASSITGSQTLPAGTSSVIIYQKGGGTLSFDNVAIGSKGEVNATVNISAIYGNRVSLSNCTVQLNNTASGNTFGIEATSADSVISLTDTTLDIRGQAGTQGVRYYSSSVMAGAITLDNSTVMATSVASGASGTFSPCSIYITRGASLILKGASWARAWVDDGNTSAPAINKVAVSSNSLSGVIGIDKSFVPVDGKAMSVAEGSAESAHGASFASNNGDNLLTEEQAGAFSCYGSPDLFAVPSEDGTQLVWKSMATDGPLEIVNADGAFIAYATSIRSALLTCDNDEIVRLRQDIDTTTGLNLVLAEGTTATLDLQGHNLTITNASPLSLSGNGTLVLKDSASADDKGRLNIVSSGERGISYIGTIDTPANGKLSLLDISVLVQILNVRNLNSFTGIYIPNSLARLEVINSVLEVAGDDSPDSSFSSIYGVQGSGNLLVTDSAISVHTDAEPLRITMGRGLGTASNSLGIIVRDLDPSEAVGSALQAQLDEYLALFGRTQATDAAYKEKMPSGYTTDEALASRIHYDSGTSDRFRMRTDVEGVTIFAFTAVGSSRFTEFYEQVTALDVPTVTGINGFTGAVNGSTITARAPHGNAVALRTGSILLSDTKLVAEGGNARGYDGYDPASLIMNFWSNTDDRYAYRYTTDTADGATALRASSSSATVTLDGALELSATAAVARQIDAANLVLGKNLSFAEAPITVANTAVTDGNAANTAFAVFADDAEPTAEACRWFSDVTDVLTPKLVENSLRWSEGHVVGFHNGETLVSEQGGYRYGAPLALPTVIPTKAADATYTYTFVGWDSDPEATVPSIALGATGLTVTADARYHAIFTPAYINYTVRFENSNGVQLSSGAYHYGDSVTQPYAPSHPGEPSEWVFVGWESSVDEAQYAVGVTLPSVTGNVTYKALYTPRPLNSYIVTWSIDGVLSSDPFTEGTVPTYTGTPARAQTAQYNYRFVGWRDTASGVEYAADATLPALTGNVSYTALFAEDLRSYQITWQVGESFENSSVTYGNLPVYAGSTPSKAADARYSYSFSGWATAPSGQALASLPIVSGDAVYYAVFDATLNKYTVTFYGDASSGAPALLQQGARDYGAAPIYTGATPARAASDDGHYEYRFLGWATSVDASAEDVLATLPVVDADVSYYAVFRADARAYSIAFNNADGRRLSSSSVSWGEVPTYNGTPRYEPEGIRFGYEFLGWSVTQDGPRLSSLPVVSGIATYWAQYKEVVTVTFVDESGTALAVPAPRTVDRSTSLGTLPAAPVRPGFYLKGWLTEAGRAFNPATPLSENLTLTVGYEVIDVSASGTMATPLVNTSQLALTDTAAANLDEAVFIVNELVSGDDYNTLMARVTADKNTKHSIWSARLLLRQGLQEVERHDNFGSIRLTFPLNSSYNGQKAVLYHLHDDGTITSTTQTIANSQVSTEVTDLSNFAVAILGNGGVGGDDENTKDNNDNNKGNTNTGGSSTNTSTGGSSTKSGTTATGGGSLSGSSLSGGSNLTGATLKGGGTNDANAEKTADANADEADSKDSGGGLAGTSLPPSNRSNVVGTTSDSDSTAGDDDPVVDDAQTSFVAKIIERIGIPWLIVLAALLLLLIASATLLLLRWRGKRGQRDEEGGGVSSGADTESASGAIQL